MKKTFVIIFCVIMLAALSSCKPGESPGTVEAQVSGWTTTSTGVEKLNILVYEAGVLPIFPLALGEASITAGSATATPLDLWGGLGIWNGEIGTSYDVYIYIDVDGDDTLNETGVDYYATANPFTVIITEEDQTIPLGDADFTIE
ncbi:MAG: hypothetical protein JSV89_01940 [Spirochaetaceae bacterium]|nr:MAG: hypothetical protein JSV89_01940 [Spirochaetaceae bacterium]